MSRSVSSESGEKLRAVLAQVPGWGGKSLVITPVSGGLTNVNWRVEVEGDRQAYFVKVPGPGTEQFINRATVNAATRQAADMGVGPAVFFYDPESGIEVGEFLDDYQACTPEDLTHAEYFSQVMGLYRVWHSGPALPETKTMFDLVEGHRVQVRRDGTVVPAWVEELLTVYDKAAARFLASGLDIVPCHNDAMPGNYMRSAVHPMKLIDYDYASNNERSYEIGGFVCEFFFDDDQTREAIESYFGHCDPRLWARVQVCRVIADVKWGLWGLVNARAWGGDFDYFKYGIWKLWRAYFFVQAADWQDQLCRL